MKGIELDEQVLRQLFNEGTPLEAIAQHFGCTCWSVRRAVQRLGLSRRRPNPRSIDLDDEEVMRLFAEGTPLEAIARRFGCSSKLVSKAVRRLGLSRRCPSPRRIDLDEDVLRQLFNEGTSFEAIAQRFGCSCSPVRKAVRRLRLKRRRPSPRRIRLADDEVLRQLFNEGVPLEAIAQHFGCSCSPVRIAVRRLGLKRGPQLPRACRENNSNWRGGRVAIAEGYVGVLVGIGHPGADVRGYILEHRLVMQTELGRPLRRDEVVHHINGSKTDNRIENLVLMTRSEHIQHHHRLARLARASRDESRDSADRSGEAVAC